MVCRVRARCLLFYCLVHLTHVSLACILLLNGWTPLTVYDRSALADIVAAGQVLRAYREERTDHGTFTANVRLLHVHKGQELVQRVRDKEGGGEPFSSSSSSSSSSVEEGGVFNISNFGDKAMCYADVTEGESYLFFLTTYDDRLSAKYDDIFGAVAEYDDVNEKQVLDYLGWYPWGLWSGCSHSCGQGRQSRYRTCSRDNVTLCEGSHVDTRHCNTFSCSDVTDLLFEFGVPKLPFGVTKCEDRKDAYVISSRAKLFAPVSNIFDVTFPQDFSLIMTFRRKPEAAAYVVVLSDISGRQRLAVFLGESLRVEYRSDVSSPATVLMFDDVTVEKDRWHSVALRFQGRRAVLYFDCNTVLERRLKRGDSFLGTNLMLSIGPYFANYGPAFEGELEQLLLSEDPSLAERQCHFQSGDHIGPIKDSGDPVKDTARTTRPPPKDVSKPTPRPVLVYADWSSWSACSASCGKGRQSRSLACTHSVAKDAKGEHARRRHGNCIPNDTPRVQVRTCETQPCTVSCPKPCQNGGTCLDSGQCRCPHGYYGNLCQSAMCTPGCQNGGVCSSPGKCQCPRNFTGNLCQIPSCTPPCLNGGRCTASNTCACPYGYTGVDCQPYCRRECHNGGVCVRHDQCRCAKGYTGRFCQQPVCRRGCSNGGRCVSPNHCSCPSGYKGRRCHKPRCRPGCKNGGTCIAPDVCLCPPGLLGPRCRKNKCNRKCRNGGRCVSPGRCECKPGFHGRFCQKEKCTLTCLNGGRCRRHKNRCRCPKGFRGRRCERRSCVYERHAVPYRKTYRRTVREEVLTSCGPWTWRSCVRTIIKYVLVSKESVRTAYRCV